MLFPYHPSVAVLAMTRRLAPLLAGLREISPDCRLCAVNFGCFRSFMLDRIARCLSRQEAAASLLQWARRVRSGPPKRGLSTGRDNVAQLILVRHGESTATEEKRFGSWMDAPLTERGADSARRCARLLREEGLDEIDVCYTSLLQRTIKTAWVLLEELNQLYVPVKPQWRLNERHYGNLTGMVKKDVVREFGAEQVQIWRRSLDVPPPPMGKDHPLYDTIHSSRQFRGVPHIPATESLVDVRERLKVLLEGELADDLRQGKRVLICAHSNSLRALITLLEGVDSVNLQKLNLPYGFPIVYDELGPDLKPVKPRRVLGDRTAVEAAIQAVCKETVLGPTPSASTADGSSSTQASGDDEERKESRRMSAA